MTGRIWLFSVVVATVASTAGCITPGYEGARLAERAGTECEIPLAMRNQVYVFVIGGDNPLETNSLETFRRGINAQGYANVATGPSIYYLWMLSEMRRIHSEMPTTAFVIAGLDVSAPVAVRLSEKVTAEGLPVFGVVVSDSSGKTAGPRNGLRTLFLRKRDSVTTDSKTDLLGTTNPNGINPAADPKNIAEVVQFLNEVALKAPLPLNNDVKTDWSYVYAPDTLITTDPKDDSEWNFMFDRIGGVTRGIAEPLPERKIIPPTGSTTAIKP